MSDFDLSDYFEDLEPYELVLFLGNASARGYDDSVFYNIFLFVIVLLFVLNPWSGNKFSIFTFFQIGFTIENVIGIITLFVFGGAVIDSLIRTKTRIRNARFAITPNWVYFKTGKKNHVERRIAVRDIVKVSSHKSMDMVRHKSATIFLKLRTKERVNLKYVSDPDQFLEVLDNVRNAGNEQTRNDV